ncbi:MAG: methyltransferase domain-containing protein [Candidatus Kariarchaeaceae archaeon]|jgi:SAM-dependent methyltransferase
MYNLYLKFDGVSCLGCVKSIEQEISNYPKVEIVDISQNNGDALILTKLKEEKLLNDLKSFAGCCDSCIISLVNIEVLDTKNVTSKNMSDEETFQLMKKQYQTALQRAIDGIEVACSEYCVCKTTNVDRFENPYGVPSFASVYNLSDHINSYLQDGMKIIDYGSGTGHDGLSIASIIKTSEIWGIDVTPEMVNYATEKANDLDLNNIKFIEGSNLDRFADESQDMVYTNNVFNLLPSKTDFIHEAFRVLKREGLLIIADEYSKSSLPVEINNDPKFQCGGISGAKSKEHILRLCIDEGFTESEFKTIKQYDIDYDMRNYPLETGILVVKKAE